jgi:NSS family neurotransmitter:Na+ symporter
MLFTLWISGLDSAFSYVEGINTNLMDFLKLPRPVTALIVTITGISLTAAFTTNIGWILFDLVDHYTSDYLVLGICLLQCVSVGW